MWAWILIDEPSPVAEDTVHTALEMALRREHRSLVIVPSMEPGKALVLGIGGAPQTRFSASMAEDLAPDTASPFAVQDPPSPFPADSEEMRTAFDSEAISPGEVELGPLEEIGPLEQVPDTDESSEVEPAAVEEVSTSMADEAPSNPSQPPSPKYVATGFLGLVDEPISEEEPPPPTKWWRKLFG